MSSQRIRIVVGTDDSDDGASARGLDMCDIVSWALLIRAAEYAVAGRMHDSSSASCA